MAKTITIPKTVDAPPLQPDEIHPAYDYSVLPDDLATEARQAVDTIRANIATVNVSILEIGHALQTMKDKLPHGEFGEWLKREIEISQRQAARFMLAYKEFGDKLDSLSNLPKTLIYILSAQSTPAELKAEVLTEISAGKTPTTASVAAKIKAAKTTSSVKKSAAKLAAEEAEKHAATYAAIAFDYLQKALPKARFKEFAITIEKADYGVFAGMIEDFLFEGEASHGG